MARVIDRTSPNFSGTGPDGYYELVSAVWVDEDLASHEELVSNQSGGLEEGINNPPVYRASIAGGYGGGQEFNESTNNGGTLVSKDGLIMPDYGDSTQYTQCLVCNDYHNSNTSWRGLSLQSAVRDAFDVSTRTGWINSSTTEIRYYIDGSAAVSANLVYNNTTKWAIWGVGPTPGNTAETRNAENADDWISRPAQTLTNTPILDSIGAFAVPADSRSQNFNAYVKLIFRGIPPQSVRAAIHADPDGALLVPEGGPPEKITGVTVTFEDDTSNLIKWTREDTADNGYHVEGRVIGSGTWLSLSTTVPQATNPEYRHDETHPTYPQGADERWEYQVAGENTNGLGAWSDPAQEPAVITLDLLADGAGSGAISVEVSKLLGMQADGVGSGSTSLEISKLLDFQADGIGSGSVEVSVDTTIRLTMSAAGAGTGSVSPEISKLLDLPAAGVGSGAVGVEITRLLGLAADGVGSGSVDLDIDNTIRLSMTAAGVGTGDVTIDVATVLALSAAGVGGAAVDVEVTRALSLQADGSGTGSVSLVLVANQELVGPSWRLMREERTWELM